MNLSALTKEKRNNQQMSLYVLDFSPGKTVENLHLKNSIS